MNKTVRHNLIKLQSFYLFAFFAMGGMSSLLSVYLSKVEGLNGYEIGTIMSVGPIIMIFFQPFWGMLSDVTSAPAKVLTIASFLAGILGLGYIAFHGFYWFLIIAIFVAIFQSAVIPVSDSISLQYSTKVSFNYGNIRLFGSLGYGVAVFILGRISESFPTSIFYSFALFFTLASIMATRFPKEKTNGPKNLLKGIKEIFTLKKYVIFLMVTFMIFGPNLANNTYFGLFIEDRGGTMTGIGFAFLIAVLSEVPFMGIAGRWITKLGLLQVGCLAGMISLLRWLFYSTEPSLPLVYVTAFLQGFSIGLFIPAGLQYVRDIIPPHIVATGVTLYSAIGNGLGNWFSTFIGGIVYEQFSIYGVYKFFALLSLFGVSLTIWLIKEEKTTKVANHVPAK